MAIVGRLIRQKMRADARPHLPPPKETVSGFASRNHRDEMQPALRAVFDAAVERLVADGTLIDDRRRS